VIDWFIVVLLASVVALALAHYARVTQPPARIRIGIFVGAIAIGLVGIVSSLALAQPAAIATSAVLVGLSSYYLYLFLKLERWLPARSLPRTMQSGSTIALQLRETPAVRFLVGVVVTVAVAAYFFVSGEPATALLVLLLVGGGVIYISRGRVTPE
jgi:hypothetical protein